MFVYVLFFSFYSFLVILFIIPYVFLSYGPCVWWWQKTTSTQKKTKSNETKTSFRHISCHRARKQIKHILQLQGLCGANIHEIIYNYSSHRLWETKMLVHYAYWLLNVLINQSINTEFVGCRYTTRPAVLTTVSGKHDQKVHSSHFLKVLVSVMS